MHAITYDNFTRSHNLVIGYFADLIIADITTGQRNRSFTEIGPRRQTHYTEMDICAPHVVWFSKEPSPSWSWVLFMIMKYIILHTYYKSLTVIHSYMYCILKSCAHFSVREWVRQRCDKQGRVGGNKRQWSWYKKVVHSCTVINFN